MEGLRRELETKEGELRRREGEREGWENDKREREGVIRGLEARMGKLERTLRDAEGERDSCKARNVALGAELEGEKSEGRKVKAELDSLRRILDEREDALKRATLEIRRLRGDRTREDDSQTRLKQTHLDLARLEKLLEAERIKVRALEGAFFCPIFLWILTSHPPVSCRRTRDTAPTPPPPHAPHYFSRILRTPL